MRANSNDPHSSKANHAPGNAPEDGPDLKKEIESLRNDVNALAHKIRALGDIAVREAEDYARQRVDGLKAAGNEKLDSARNCIKAHPVQNLTTGFLAGVLAAFLLGRKP